ncbi:STAS domain-containing protein [Clostridiaceae bacterium M8S5]|nr:STAS domain-containing protein [Clostridiaceae bacterium M8S5]
MSLIIEKYAIESGNVIKPIGDIDISTSNGFKEELISYIEEKKSDIVVDCAKLEYIDSTGLGVMISGLKRIKEYNKNIILKDMKKSILKLFEITELDKVFIVE